MIRIIDGQPAQVPDDESITPELRDLRTMMNTFLQAISADTPQNRALHEQYLKGRLSDGPAFEWYQDITPPK